MKEPEIREFDLNEPDIKGAGMKARDMNKKPRDQVAELLDNATSGLRDDPELQLEVRAELASHLDAAEAELRGKGISEEDSRELALKGFGSSVEIAEDLVNANRTRMKLRALARLTARAVVVPLAVVLAVWIFVNAPYFMLVGEGGIYNSRSLERAKEVLESQIPKDKLPLWEHSFFWMREWEQQRAIWESEPDNKVYYGNYISYLSQKIPLIKYSDYSSISERLPESITPEFIENEFYRGMELDPDNARYNYLLASFWLSQAVTLEIEIENVDGEHIKRDILEIKDQVLVDKAMDEVLKGIAKPYCKTYVLEMLKELLDLLPPARTMSQQLFKNQILSSSLTPDGPIANRIIRVINQYAKVLAAEGEEERAIQILQSWHPFLMQHVRDMSLYFDQCNYIYALTHTAKTGIVDTLNEIGRHDLADATQDLADRLFQPFADLQEEEQAMYDRDYWGKINSKKPRHSSILYSDLHLSEQDFVVGRWLELIMHERPASAILMVFFLVLMVGALLVALRWRFASGHKPSAFMLPSSGALTKIFGLGILTPMLVYWLYTRMSSIAGREYSYFLLGPRFNLELGLLGATILFLTAHLAARTVRERCATFGMPVPPLPGKTLRKLPGILLALSWGACLLMRYREDALLASLIIGLPLVFMAVVYPINILIRACDGRNQVEIKRTTKRLISALLFFGLLAAAFIYYLVLIDLAWTELDRESNIFAIIFKMLMLVVCAIIITLPLLLFRRRIARWLQDSDKESPDSELVYSFYYSSVARSLLPIFAAAVIILALISQSYLSYQEVTLVQQDRIMHFDTEKPYLGRLNSIVIDRLKTEIEGIAAEIEAENN